MLTDSNSEPEEPLLPLSWLVRTKTTRTPAKPGECDTVRITSELVWGRMEKNKDKLTIVTGEAHHVLTGATSEQTMQVFADDLNRKQYVPAEKPPRSRADGYRQGKNAPNTLHRDFELPESYK